MISRLLAFWHALLNRRRIESEMDAELRFHVKAYADDLVRSGVRHAEAERRAYIEFGGVALAKEDCRRSLGLRLVDEVHQDLRYAVRSLRKSPAFTAAALLSLALGIGANTVVFSFVDAVLLKAFPYRQPSSLVDVSELDQNQMGRPLREILDLPAQSQTLAEIAVTPVFPVSYNMTGPLLGYPERVSGAAVTTNYFEMLGVRPSLGNSFSATQSEPGRESAVLLSNRFWRTTLGANPAIAGRSVLLDGQEYRIFGVLPPGEFDRTTLQFWIPLSHTPKNLQKDDFYRTTARLKSGVTQVQANADLARFKAKARTLRGALVRPETGKLLGLLAGAVGFVLMIACANVANLMLARAAARQREVAIRISTGADRARLVRQFLTESLALSLVAGALGAALAAILLPVIVRIVPAHFLPLEAKPVLDGRVFLFTLAATLLTGLLFGAAPAWRFSAAPAQAVSRHARTHRLRDALLIAEAALVVVLAAGAGLMIHSFARLLAVDPGLQPERVVTWSVQFEKRVNEIPQIRAYQEEFLRRLRQVPAVESAAVSNAIPFSGGFTAVVEIAGAATLKGDAMVWTVTPEYLATMGMRMLRGRWFTSADGSAAPPIAVVSRSFAQRYYGGANPIGRLVKPRIFTDAYAEIVGIADSVKFDGLAAKSLVPELYLPLAQAAPRSVNRSFYFSARTRGDAAAVLPAVHSIAASLAKDQPVYDFRVMEDRIAETIQLPRFQAALFGALGGLALLLAAVGIYGVLHYAVVQRTNEIGVRMAMGARRRDIVIMVLWQSMARVGAGMAVGLAGALAFTRLLGSMLFEVAPRDPLTLAAVTAVVAGAALGAAWIPARRAAAVEPVVALRHE